MRCSWAQWVMGSCSLKRQVVQPCWHERTSAPNRDCPGLKSGLSNQSIIELFGGESGEPNEVERLGYTRVSIRDRNLDLLLNAVREKRYQKIVYEQLNDEARIGPHSGCHAGYFGIWRSPDWPLMTWLV